MTNERKTIADTLIKLAENIATKSHDTGELIESISDAEIPAIANNGIEFIVQDVVEGWAHTYKDMLAGGASEYELDNSDARKALLSVPLELCPELRQ